MALTIAVVGASGQTGSAIIKFLAAHGQTATILAGVRDPACEKAKQLVTASPNVMLMHADLAQPNSLINIMRTADVAFINMPSKENRTELMLNGVNAAKIGMVKHLVMLSVTTAEYPGTIFGQQSAPVEAAIRASGIPYTILRFPFFLENNWLHQKTIKDAGKIYGPLRPDVQYTPIAVADIGESIGTVLLNPMLHVNRVYTITSSSITEAELAAAFSKVIGKKVDYEQVDFKKAKKAFMAQGFPEWQTDGMLEMYKLMDSGAPQFNNAGVDYRLITGHDPISPQQWVQQVGAAFKTGLTEQK